MIYCKYIYENAHKIHVKKTLILKNIRFTAFENT